MVLKTHSSVEGGLQVRNKHLWVDIVQVPGKVVTVELFPQLQSFRNVTEGFLSMKPAP